MFTRGYRNDKNITKKITNSASTRFARHVLSDGSTAWHALHSVVPAVAATVAEEEPSSARLVGAATIPGRCTRAATVGDGTKRNDHTLWLFNIPSGNLTLAIEIVDLPINSMVIFHSKLLKGPSIEDLWWLTYQKWCFSIATLNHQAVFCLVDYSTNMGRTMSLTTHLGMVCTTYLRRFGH